MRIDADGELQDNILVTKRIRQEDSVTPILFIIIMNGIIEEVKDMKRYGMGSILFVMATVLYY